MSLLTVDRGTLVSVLVTVDLDTWDHGSRLVDDAPYDLSIGGQLTVRVGQGEAKDECQR